MGTYFISPQGDDGNDGLSVQRAVRTWSKISTLATGDGDTITVLPGSYHAGTLIPSGNLTIRGYGELHGNARVIIDGRATGTVTPFTGLSGVSGVWKVTDFSGAPSVSLFSLYTGEPYSGFVELHGVAGTSFVDSLGLWYTDLAGEVLVSEAGSSPPFILYESGAPWLNLNGKTIRLENLTLKYFGSTAIEGSGTLQGESLLFENCGCGLSGGFDADLEDVYFYRCETPFHLSGDAYFRDTQVLACTHRGVFLGANSGNFWVWGQLDPAPFASGASGQVIHSLQKPIRPPYPALRNLCLDQVGVHSGSLSLLEGAAQAGPISCSVVTRGKAEYPPTGWWRNRLPGVEVAFGGQCPLWVDDGRFRNSPEHDTVAAYLRYVGPGSNPSVELIQDPSGGSVLQLRASDFSGDFYLTGEDSDIGLLTEISQTGNWACWLNYPSKEVQDQRQAAPTEWLTGLSYTSATGLVALHFSLEAVFSGNADCDVDRVTTDVVVHPYGLPDYFSDYDQAWGYSGGYDQLRWSLPEYGRGSLDNHGQVDNFRRGIETWRLGAFLVTGASDLSEDAAVWYQHWGRPYNAYTYPNLVDQQTLEEIIRAFPGYMTLEEEKRILENSIGFGDGVRGLPEPEADFLERSKK